MLLTSINNKFKNYKKILYFINYFILFQEDIPYLTFVILT